MVPDELPVYTVTEIEQRARTYLLQKLGRSPSIPIDVDLLIEDGEKIDLQDYPALQANYGILGAVWKDLDSGELVVTIDDALMSDESPTGWARYRMTVAEELAHLKLHREVVERLESADDFRALHRHPQWSEVERNAKRFAAAILMPPKILDREAEVGFAEIVEQLRQRGMDTITQEPVEKWLCTRLARRFEVSEAAMRIRMREWPAEINEKIASAIRDGRDYF